MRWTEQGHHMGRGSLHYVYQDLILALQMQWLSSYQGLETELGRRMSHVGERGAWDCCIQYLLFWHAWPRHQSPGSRSREANSFLFSNWLRSVEGAKHYHIYNILELEGYEDPVDRGSAATAPNPWRLLASLQLTE